MSDYELIRSPRKTLGLTVDNNGRLVVRAPMTLSEDAIQNFIREKSRWIAEKQRQAAVRIEKQRACTLDAGESLLYLGKSFRLRRRDVREITAAGSLLTIPAKTTAAMLANWLRLQAAPYIRQRAEHYAKEMGVGYTSLKLSGAAKRWGSCGPKNSLNFSWRLIMCPPWVIDYVVVHELSHITHKNHGSQFWRQVAATLPNYQTAKDWLRSNSYLLATMR